MRGTHPRGHEEQLGLHVRGEATCQEFARSPRLEELQDTWGETDGAQRLHRATDGTERDLCGALPTSSVGSGQSVKLYFPMATSIGKRS